MYTLAMARNRYPELATFRGLQDASHAGLFQRALTLGQYCKALRALAKGQASLFDDLFPEATLEVVGDDTQPERTAVVTRANHGYVVGDLVKISLAASSPINNGVKTITAVPDDNTFHYVTVGKVTPPENVVLGLEEYDGRASNKQSFCYVFYTYELEVEEKIGKVPKNLDMIDTCADIEWADLLATQTVTDPDTGEERQEPGPALKGPWGQKNVLSEDAIKLLRNTDPEAADAAEATIAEAEAVPPKVPLELCARFIVTEADFGRVAVNLG